MTVTVRDLRAGDLDAAHRVIADNQPYLVLSPEMLAWQVENAPPAQRYRVLVAEGDDGPVGVVRCGVEWETSLPGQGSATIDVAPGARGRGVGTALLAAAESYLAAEGVTTAHGWVSDDDAARRFADRHGYALARSASFQRLDLAALPPVPPTPAGVEVVAWSAFADDPRPLWVADAEASRDEPGEVPADAIDFEGWSEAVWRRPDVDRELSRAAVVDGRVAAFTLVQTAPPRYWSGMTGSVRAYRGRGLVKLIKCASLHAARERGLTVAYTGNDGTNEPMLAVNRWLGYRPDVVQWRCRRDLA